MNDDDDDETKYPKLFGKRPHRVSSPLATSNAFAACAGQSVTCSGGGRNALLRRYVAMQRHMSPLESTPSPGRCGLHLPHGSLDPHESGPTISRSVQPFLHSSPVCQTHRHTDHAMCDICSNRPHLYSA